MKRFTDLYHELDASNRTTSKLAALKRYFSSVDPADGAWAVFFLTGNRLKRAIQLKDLRLWAAEACGYPEWMVEECYDHVGDLAETLALLLASRDAQEHTVVDISLHAFVERNLLPLKEMESTEQRERLLELWGGMDASSCFIVNKLITGGFRVGVSKTLVTRALAEVAEFEPAAMAHRLMGTFQPSAAAYRGLFDAEAQGDQEAQPYPFCLAYPLDATNGIEVSLGPVSDWQIEWKWDGIRAQLIRRGGEVILWSRGEEMLSEQFPEVIEAAAHWPDEVVLDGELLVWDCEADQVAPFSALQRRLGRKKVGPKLRNEVPVIFMAYDCLELNREDLRDRATRERRRLLRKYCDQISDSVLRCSPLVEVSDWQAAGVAREQSRARRVEGLMLKQAGSAYGAGRKKGQWWKWKIDPYTIDAVMVYAQQGHGRRAGLYTDYTFSIWKDGELVPFAKAYSGLSDTEIRQVDRWIRAHTREKHGPVRVVDPELVFEIAFEGISESKRHKSGIAVRFPRISRWRRDKPAAEADSLETILGLL